MGRRCGPRPLLRPSPARRADGPGRKAGHRQAGAQADPPLPGSGGHGRRREAAERGGDPAGLPALPAALPTSCSTTSTGAGASAATASSATPTTSRSTSRSERAAERVMREHQRVHRATPQAAGQPRQVRGRPRDEADPSGVRLLRARRSGQGQDRPQGPQAGQGSPAPPHLPQLGRLDGAAHRRHQPLHGRLDGLLRVGRDALGLRRARRVAPPPAAAGALEGVEALRDHGGATCARSVSPSEQAREWAGSRKGYWRIAGSASAPRALPNAYWRDLGLPASPIPTAVSGMRREPPDADPHVRWCGRGRGKPGPYPIDLPAWS